MRPKLNDSEAAVFLSGSPPEILADGGAAAYGKPRSSQPHQPSRTYVPTLFGDALRVFALYQKGTTIATDTTLDAGGIKMLWSRQY
jgi:hypothetical protein